MVASIVPVHVSESVSKNMVMVSLQSSEFDSAIKDPLVIPDLSSPHDTLPDDTLWVAWRPRPASKEKVLCGP